MRLPAARFVGKDLALTLGLDILDGGHDGVVKFADCEVTVDHHFEDLPNVVATGLNISI